MVLCRSCVATYLVPVYCCCILLRIVFLLHWQFSCLFCAVGDTQGKGNLKKAPRYSTLLGYQTLLMHNAINTVVLSVLYYQTQGAQKAGWQPLRTTFVSCCQSCCPIPGIAQWVRGANANIKQQCDTLPQQYLENCLSTYCFFLFTYVHFQVS